MATRGMAGRAIPGKPPARMLSGFTLMDLVAALAIAGLLACVAVPSYRAQVLRTHRSDARAALLALAAAEESFHATCNAYAAILDDASESSCGASSLKIPADVGPGAYLLAVVSSDTKSWTATATAVAGGSQAADERCRVLSFSSAGIRTASGTDGARNDEECWTR
jgi:type IV pilus assembly protein PilE